MFWSVRHLKFFFILLEIASNFYKGSEWSHCVFFISNLKSKLTLTQAVHENIIFFTFFKVYGIVIRANPVRHSCHSTMDWGF